MNKRFVTTALLLCMSVLLLAQRSRLEKANAYLATHQYQKAIDVYHKILERSDILEVKVKLAEAYRKIKDYENAEQWYAKIVNRVESEPVEKYYYALMLQRNGHCEKATDWYKRYLAEKPIDPRAPQMKNLCAYQKELVTKNVDLYQVDEISINSRYDDLGPTYYYQGLVFSSERSKGAVTGSASGASKYMDLYYTETAQFDGESCGTMKYGQPIVFSPKLNTKHHEAITTFNADESEIFFTQNYSNKEDVNELDLMSLKILYAKSLGDGKWEAVKELPFNSESYSVAHPSLTPDSRYLFFSSDMPGGYGGKDIYMAERTGDRWGVPINLGPAVNTPGDELYPHFQKGGRIYFSSDGHIGLGGQDIYFARQDKDGNWVETENLGYPINTYYDDFGIIFHRGGACGYFVSNREDGTGGADIYSFYKNSVMVQVFVNDLDNGEALEEVSIENDCSRLTRMTDYDGRVLMDLKTNNCCKLKLDFPGYLPKTTEICTNDFSSGDTATVLIPLKRETAYELTGFVFDQSTGRPVGGAVVSLINQECTPPRPILTNPSGRFRFKLKKDCCYGIKAEKGNFFTHISTENICTKGPDAKFDISMNLFLDPFLNGAVASTQNTGRSTSSNTTATPPKAYEQPRYDDVKSAKKLEDFNTESKLEESTKNQPFLLNVYYDFGRSSIQRKAVPELKKLQQILMENPDLVVEISSHTDSRGSSRFNQKLSQRRAEAVVKWLVQNGVSSRRLAARGYGEEYLVNNCTDDRECEESEHQLNRRTEFRVIGKK